jgi:hypothetical protein
MSPGFYKRKILGVWVDLNQSHTPEHFYYFDTLDQLGLCAWLASFFLKKKQNLCNCVFDDFFILFLKNFII